MARIMKTSAFAITSCICSLLLALLACPLYASEKRDVHSKYYAMEKADVLRVVPEINNDFPGIEYTFLIIKKDNHLNYTHVWPCKIVWKSDGYSYGEAIIYQPKRIVKERAVKLFAEILVFELGGHEKYEAACTFIDRVVYRRQQSSKSPHDFSKYLIIDNHKRHLISPEDTSNHKRYIIIQTGNKLGSDKVTASVLMIDEKDLLLHAINGAISYTWAYPTSCVTLPDVGDKENDTIACAINDIRSIMASHEAVKVYVNVFGFADKKERPDKKEKDDKKKDDLVASNHNLIVSRARALGWKKTIEEQIIGQNKALRDRIEVIEWWFGHEMHNEVLSVAAMPGINPYLKYVSEHDSNEGRKTVFANPDTSLNRRVEIYISTSKEPQVVQGWIALWKKLRSEGKLYVDKSKWEGYTKQRDVIRDDQNIPGKRVPIEDDLVKMQDMAK